ncbi:MAG: dihydroneopterin aldolase [Candidatus Cloacimonetes bacterium]|nr:dihydroneopterin aldolase [Candidatus Cloacimonadota bacterium]
MKIHLNNMLFYGFHGVFPEERKLGQKFNVSMTIYTDDAFDTEIKELKDTADYTAIYAVIKNIMENRQFHLLEDCANTIITDILNDFSLVIGVKVIIEKPGVPMQANLSSVSVEMKRMRNID